MVFEAKGDIDWVPEIFKIREDFPLNSNTKRNLEHVRNETEGFHFISKEHLQE